MSSGTVSHILWSRHRTVYVFGDSCVLPARFPVVFIINKKKESTQERRRRRSVDTLAKLTEFLFIPIKIVNADGQIIKSALN